MGVLGEGRSWAVGKALDHVFSSFFEERDLDNLAHELEEIARTSESCDNRTILDRGIFAQCLQECGTIEKIMDYALGAPGHNSVLEQEDVFLSRLQNELIEKLKWRGIRSLRGLDGRVIRRLLERFLQKVKVFLAEKTPLQNKEILYMERENLALSKEAHQLITKILEYMQPEQDVRPRQKVTLSVQLPPLEGVKYAFQYIRSGMDEWDEKGPLENRWVYMVKHDDDRYSVSFEDVPTAWGFQFKCCAECGTEEDAVVVCETLKAHFYSLYQQSKFPEYENGTVFVDTANGREREFELVHRSTAHGRKVWFILPWYHPYVTSDKNHPFLNNYYHCSEERGGW